ncbi:unnamed protein product, partial [Effrenium voratum]
PRPVRRKFSLRSKKSFNECAPPPWLGAAVSSEADDAASDCDSVVSDYRDDLPESQEASTIAASSALNSSGSDFALLPDKKADKALKKETELPALKSGSRGPTSGTSSERSSFDTRERSSLERSSVDAPSPTSVASKAGVTPEASGSMSENLAVSASTAGEWVTRLAALQEVAVEHSTCAGKIWSTVEEMFPEVAFMDDATKRKMQEEIFTELELSRELLERHAQGLVGTDLAELRMIKSETKRLNDRMERMSKLHAKELNALRAVFAKKEVVAPKEDYEPLAFLEPAERGCVLGLLEQHLEALFREDPEIQHQTNQRELTRLQDLFKKEQVSALERQVAKLTQQLEAAREQTAALEVWNLDLTKKMRQVRRTSSSGSRTLDEGKPREKELLTPQSGAEDGSPEAFIPSPAGRPKSGRPKRPAVRPVAK